MAQRLNCFSHTQHVRTYTSRYHAIERTNNSFIPFYPPQICARVVCPTIMKLVPHFVVIYSDINQHHFSRDYVRPYSVCYPSHFREVLGPIRFSCTSTHTEPDKPPQRPPNMADIHTPIPNLKLNDGTSIPMVHCIPQTHPHSLSKPSH